MKCVICKHGETLPGIITVTLTRDEIVFVFKGVPVDVCDGLEVEIQRYTA